LVPVRRELTIYFRMREQVCSRPLKTFRTMTDRDFAALKAELTELRSRVAQLEAEASAAEPLNREWTRGYYLTYYATTGFFLGMVAALASLLFNIAGSLIVGQHPLQLIRVYLTFGLGSRALDLQLDKGDGGLTLIIGCCLYIATGMLLGVLFQVVLSRFADKASLAKRLTIATVVALLVWVVNFYVLLAWVQPLLFGGNWMVDPHFLPPWVAALTHLVFGWTMAVIYPWGMYEPYQVQAE
jgi:hypothetical protein